jgi:hypothetical protein
MIASKLRSALIDSKGFTGVEFLAILAVIGALAAILAPMAGPHYGESISSAEERRAKNDVNLIDEMLVDVTNVNFDLLEPVVIQETFFADYVANDFDALTSENLIADMKFRILGELMPFDRGSCEGFAVDPVSRYSDESVRLIGISSDPKKTNEAIMKRLC